MSYLLIFGSTMHQANLEQYRVMYSYLLVHCLRTYSGNAEYLLIHVFGGTMYQANLEQYRVMYSYLAVHCLRTYSSTIGLTAYIWQNNSQGYTQVISVAECTRTYLAVTVQCNVTGQYTIYQAVPDYLFVSVNTVTPGMCKQLQININSALPIDKKLSTLFSRWPPK